MSWRTISHFYKPPSVRRQGRCAEVVCLALLLASGVTAHAVDNDAFRGLWVGTVKLSYVTEVPVALNSNNVAVAPDPKVPTPTFDDADLRLILHVNGAGQVNLLKDVAVLNRRAGEGLLVSENDLALVTDEALYGQFPAQPAQRIASAAFDFGDRYASDAVNAIIDAAVAAVAPSVNTNTADLTTTSGRTAAENAAAQLARTAATPIAQNADVATAFTSFLTGTNFNSAVVNALAASGNPLADAQPALVAATNLQNRSFYHDSRAIQMVLAVVSAITNGGTNLANRRSLGQNTAASFDDIANEYQRFIMGKQFGDMIVKSAAAAASAVTNPAATVATISNAATNNPDATAAKATALGFRSTRYTDNRGSDAINLTLGAIQSAALAEFASTNKNYSQVKLTVQLAGFDTLATNVIRYALASEAPTPNYNDFVRSTTFLGSVDTAATAAAEAAVSEKKNNGLFTLESLEIQARLGAVRALESVLSAAARAVRNELPMTGRFATNAGDARLTWQLRQTNSVANLGSAALTGTVFLPANHPTNPFRHRRHPDHTTGYDVTRQLRLDFDATSGGPMTRSGYGVDRITGVYREEIFGLHKKLGPQKDLGLRVEGTFELNRISLIDTLNAR